MIPTARETAIHEAHHCAALLAQGMTPKEVRTDWPGHGLAGQVTIDWGDGPNQESMAIVLRSIVVGGMCDGFDGWGSWPIDPDHMPHGARRDVEQARHLAERLKLDEVTWRFELFKANRLATTPEFRTLAVRIADELERREVLTAEELRQIHDDVRGGTVEHLDVKVIANVVTDEGVFEAVISTQSVDREKDIVSPKAMVDALRKWNRPIPLAWHHSTNAQDIFGSIDPQSVRAVNGEVVARGDVDLDSEVGREAWRSFKNRTIGFSFGYLIPEGGATKRTAGGRYITALDVFEVTATPTPANNDTRVLSTKSVNVDTSDEIPFMSDLFNHPFDGSMRAEPQHKSQPIRVATFEC